MNDSTTFTFNLPSLYPFCIFSGANHRSAQVLLLLVIPGHLIFLYTIHLMKSGHTTLTPIFMSVYLAAAMLQVSTFLMPMRFNVSEALECKNSLFYIHCSSFHIKMGPFSQSRVLI